jgi:hypothetical protein
VLGSIVGRAIGEPGGTGMDPGIEVWRRAIQVDGTNQNLAVTLFNQSVVIRWQEPVVHQLTKLTGAPTMENVIEARIETAPIVNRHEKTSGEIGDSIDIVMPSHRAGGW